MKTKIKKRYILAAIILIGLLIPQKYSIPVAGATKNSYNPKSFWYYPWGKSVTHKGIDIFAKEGTDVNAATSGLVLYTGTLGMGGNVVVLLGPKWRLHYYAHLKDVHTHTLGWASRGEAIATVGSTGNAAGKPPHLHYSMVTLIPYPWRIDRDRQGLMKMFYLDPTGYIEEDLDK
ncbi:M23 family metallopeptidase [Flavobacterium sp. RHBU_3]|uniref:M23 family metallopeptidase n=1 Tax=Flavobacterium sp. RHBU_3 TaxID=3391184 RepID=UPI0039848E52